MVKGHGLHRSEHLTPDELFGGEGSDLLPAVEDAEVAVVLLDPDVVPGEAAADEDLVPAEGDLAAGADLAGVVPGLVLGLGEGGGPFAVAGPPAGDGGQVAECLVGAEGVVHAPPPLGVV